MIYLLQLPDGTILQCRDAFNAHQLASIYLLLLRPDPPPPSPT